MALMEALLAEGAAISWAQWVVGKALSPLSDGLVEAWAATTELEPNIKALKVELLNAQAVLHTARRREIDNPALAELLQMLRGLGYQAEDVLDELDYFRIQDELEGTFEAVDDLGCAPNLLRDARHAATAAAKKLSCTSCLSTAGGSDGRTDDASCRCARRLASGARTTAHAARAAAKKLWCASCMSTACGSGDHADESCKCVCPLASRARTTAHAAKQSASPPSSTAPGSDEETCQGVRQLASRARTLANAFGKRLLCSSHLSVSEDDDSASDFSDGDSASDFSDGDSASDFSDGDNVRDNSKHAPRVPKLKFHRVDVSRRMKCIADELKPLCAKVSTILGLELSGSVISEIRLGSSRAIGNAPSSSRPITTSQALEPTLYGRDAQKNTIVENITEGECIHRHLTVIPIVGPGGIGKTTLTQYIYNNKKVKAHFDIRVWVCVSLDFSVYKLTKEIVGSIPKAQDEKNDRPDNEVQNLDQLQKLIESRLRNRRFLLVLDDIWKYGNEDEWNRFLVPFKKVQGNGDTVLVTTRFLEVAAMVKKGDKLLQLEGLEPKEYWNLFLACVFNETNQQCNDNKLLEIGKKIVEKLKGSPLAAKTVGSLLRKNLTVDLWTRVLESREWESQTGDRDIMPALKLSYDYLPFHLQQCFSSCALFPEDYKFYCEELIHFWIGLDILCSGHTSRTKRIEDIGLHDLNELVNHGFFKKETDDSGTHYVMHDLLHDLALKVSSQECLHVASSSPRDVEIAQSVYHLSISISDTAGSEDGVFEEKFNKKLDKIRNMVKFENLRTLMLFGNYDASFVRVFKDLLKNAKSLRVVLLSTMHYPVEFLLHNVSNLVHLRYLRLVSADYGCKEHLPRNISRFYQLRVLDIRRWYGDHILLGDMANLVNLRHFLSRKDKVHSNICNVGKLHSLQELRRFKVRKEGSGFQIRELGELEELGGSLGIYNLENALANEAKLLYKNRLHELTLSWKKGRSNTNPTAEDQLLESLRPHSNLHELCIDGHGGITCPTWLGTNLSTRGLEALRLDCIDWQFLPPLGELYLVHETGEEYFGCTTGQNFRNLKRLELIGLPRFRRWVANEFCPWYLSLIEVLAVKDCPELIELPFSSCTTCYTPERDLNRTWFPRLREIEIRNCSKLLSLPPTPYSHTLYRVTLRNSGRGLRRLDYINKEKYLAIEGNDALHSLDATILAFDNLTHLGTLSMKNCPPLAEEHLQMLTSLESLIINGSSIIFLPFARSDAKWQLPVTRLNITRWSASGKALSRLVSHLPELSRLTIDNCEQVKRLGVESEQQQTAAPLSLPASSAIKLQDTHGTDQQEIIEQEVEVGVEEVLAAEVVVEQEEDDGLLLLPAHLSDSLQNLWISHCPVLILTAQDSGAGGGLQAMCSLKKIGIENCPNFLSAYSASGLSSRCPFPSSLQDLTLWGHMEGMDTLVPLSNLTSLQVLRVLNWGDDLRCGGLLHLLTQGQLTTLEVRSSPKFFAGWDPAQELQGEQEQPSSKLQELETNDIAGVLAAPICKLLSSSLTKLSFEFNEEVEDLAKEQEEALSLLTSLQELQFWRCDKLRRLPAGLHKLNNLKRLEIWTCPAIRSLSKNGLPNSLQELSIAGCIKLRFLPSGLHRVTSLKILEINDCPAMRSLPKNGLPSSLQELDVSRCNNKVLQQQCRRLMGTIPTIKL